MVGTSAGQNSPSRRCALARVDRANGCGRSALAPVSVSRVQDSHISASKGSGRTPTRPTAGRRAETRPHAVQPVSETGAEVLGAGTSGLADRLTSLPGRRWRARCARTRRELVANCMAMPPPSEWPTRSPVVTRAAIRRDPAVVGAQAVVAGAWPTRRGEDVRRHHGCREPELRAGAPSPTAGDAWIATGSPAAALR